MAQVNTAEDLTRHEQASGPFESEATEHLETSDEDSAFEDRRAWQRFILEEPAQITLQIEGLSSVEQVPLLDVSLGGFRLHFDRDLPRGSDVAICHPTAGTMRGRLAWQADGDIGVRMLDDENRRTYLLRLISMILHSEIQVAAV